MADVSANAATAADSPKTTATKRFGGTQERCDICTKVAYPTEKITADGKIFHKNCIRCAKCDKVLSLGNYATGADKSFYCKPHFAELFKLKGNYDEGFGKEKHTKQWQQ